MAVGNGDEHLEKMVIFLEGEKDEHLLANKVHIFLIILGFLEGAQDAQLAHSREG